MSGLHLALIETNCKENATERHEVEQEERCIMYLGMFNIIKMSFFLKFCKLNMISINLPTFFKNTELLQKSLRWSSSFHQKSPIMVPSWVAKFISLKFL